VENTTLQQHFTKENHEGMKFKVFLMKTTTKKFQKRLQQQIDFGQTALLQTQIRQLSGYLSTKNFIPMCSYIYADQSCKTIAGCTHLSLTHDTETLTLFYHH